MIPPPRGRRILAGLVFFLIMDQAVLTGTWLGLEPLKPGRFSVRNRTKKQPIGPVGLLRVGGRADDPTL
jgi:hypothetical protein